VPTDTHYPGTKKPFFLSFSFLRLVERRSKAAERGPEAALPRSPEAAARSRTAAEQPGSRTAAEPRSRTAAEPGSQSHCCGARKPHCRGARKPHVVNAPVIDTESVRATGGRRKCSGAGSAETVCTGRETQRSLTTVAMNPRAGFWISGHSATCNGLSSS
jgi:hypothetical protein